MYLATIKADRIVVRYEKDTRFGDGAIQLINSRYKKEVNKEKRACKSQSSLNNLGKKKSTVSLSNQSKRNIRDSIQLMYQLSSPRKVKISDKKFIYNYRTSFVTLTLPSSQIHTDVEIKKCLDKFLTHLRNTLGIKNYVWKAELQRNENIHFHLVIDKYCSYQAIRYYWNLVLSKLGYIKRYSDKFKNMSLLEYANYRNMKVEECKDAYFKGCKSEWSVPNSVTVNAMRSSKQLAYYLTKYLTKDFSKDNNNNDDIDRIENFGKVWARSQSISRIKLITRWCWSSLRNNISSLINKKNIVVKQYEYCTVYYIQFNKKVDQLVKWLRSNLINQAKYFNYPFPAT